MATAMLQYCSGISTVFPAWGHLTWPVPPPWHLIKRDEGSSKQRAQAADEFAHLASNSEGDERNDLLVWRLACLANEPNSQNDATALCTSLLKQSAGYVPALVWARQRNFEFDKTASLTALRARMEAKDLHADEIIALFALMTDAEGVGAGEKLLDDQRPTFEESNKLSLWRAHKVQCLVARGETEAAIELVDDETDSIMKRHVRQAMLGAHARKDGNHESLGADCENEFRETGDGEALLSSCLSRRIVGNWPFVADHAEEVIRLVGTDAALRVGVEGAINARRPELVLKLLEAHVGLCPGGVLPPDLQRLRAEAHRQLGRFGKAVEEVERAASVSPDVHTLMHLFRLKRTKGDLIGSAETAKQFLKLPHVPVEFLTEEVAPAIRHVAPELTRELMLKAQQSLPSDSPVLLLVAQQASKLGLGDVAAEVFQKLPAWAGKGVGGIEAVNLTRITEILRQERESWADAFQRYRRGQIPVHALCLHFNVLLARWFLEMPRTNAEGRFPVAAWPILARHAALAGEAPVQLDSNQELFLDVTSILLLHGMNLLTAVESVFPKIAVSAHLAAWLQAEADKLQPEQPEQVVAQQTALELIDAGKIYIWSNNPSFVSSTENWAVRMGPMWCERLAHVKSNAGVLVDLMPLLANQPEMEPVVLPEIETAYVVGEADIVSNLESNGRISAAEAANARKKLGLLDSHQNYNPRAIKLHPEFEVHLENGIAERLALARILKPLSESARILVHESQVQQWREETKRGRANAILLSDLEELLAHISRCFDSDHYRGHECRNPHVPPGHRGPLTEKELCIQDNFDYAENGQGIWCNDDRMLRGLRGGPNRSCVDTFDLIYHLKCAGRLNEADFYDTLLRIRASNVRYLPITSSEIIYHLRRAPVENSDLKETQALAVLRRSIAASLLDAEWLQRPVETPQGQRLLLEAEYPVRLYLAVARVLVDIWRHAESLPELRVAQSEWLWSQLFSDIRLMQELFGAPAGGMPPLEAVGHTLGHLFAQAIEIPGGERKHLRAAYFEWLFKHCVAPHLSNNPGILACIAHPLRRLVDETLSEMDVTEKESGKKGHEYVGRMVLIGQFLFDLPPTVLDALRLSPEELSRFGLARSNAPFEVLGVALEPSEFWPAVGRALTRGYAAILKPGTRLQMRRDDVSGRILIRRKGNDARNGGHLNVPCVMLLSTQRSERINALESSANLFDLNKSRREEVFKGLSEIASPIERMQRLHAQLETSASWFYRCFEERARDSQSRTRPWNISELLPDDVSILRRHLRLAPLQEAKTEPAWAEAVQILLDEEGLEETLVRLSCLPARLPDLIFDRFSALKDTEIELLLKRLSARAQSVLPRLQFLLITLRFGKDLPLQIARAKRELALLLDPQNGTHTANALVALFRWSHLRLGWLPSAKEWSPETRLRVAWAHASRVHSAFTVGQFPHKELAEWISSGFVRLANCGQFDHYFRTHVGTLMQSAFSPLEAGTS